MADKELSVKVSFKTNQAEAAINGLFQKLSKLEGKLKDISKSNVDEKLDKICKKAKLTADELRNVQSVAWQLVIPLRQVGQSMLPIVTGSKEVANQAENIGGLWDQNAMKLKAFLWLYEQYARQTASHTLGGGNSQLKLPAPGLVPYNGVDYIDAKWREVKDEVNKTNSSIKQQISPTKKLLQLTDGLDAEWTEVGRSSRRVRLDLDGLPETVRRMNQRLRGSTSIANNFLNTIRRIAAAYLSIQGIKTAVNTSDDITSAKNRLNYANANALGDDLAVSSNGGYSTQVLNMTKEQMDRMYTASQKANSSYTDMMHNTSKMMALAGDAFDGSTDAAIRFNEVMAKAYTIGGSSASEISSSMMQLTQALASGRLQGDELRSVRENAPLVYKAIEDVAHRVWNSTEDANKSLKQLGAEGKVSAEMIVNAVLGMSDKIDTAFERTQIQFNHIWQNIKNAAVKAFEPVSERLSEMLTEAVNNGALEKIETVFAKVSRVLQLVLVKVKQGITWIIENWDTIKKAILLALSAIITFYIVVAAVGIYSVVQQIRGWLQLNTILWANVFVFAAILIGILGLIYIFLLWKTAAIDTCTAIAYALMLVGAVLLVIGLIIGSIPMLIIGAVVAALGLIFYFFEEVSGGISGIVNWLGAACYNIGVFFSNLWYGATSKFWEFIGNVLSGMKDLEPAFNAIAKMLGLHGVTISGLSQVAYDKANAAKQNTKNYRNLEYAWNTGYAKGSKWGNGVVDSINNWGSQHQNWNLDSLNANALFAGIGSKTADPNALDPSIYSPELLGTTGANDPNLPNLDDNQLKATCEDISEINDKMDLTEEDLSYLRDVANMEWKKEFTTANIIVDMTNNNTITGKDGIGDIVTTLSDALREELNILSDGVYAY